MKKLQKIFLDSKYILDLKDDWDDEGSVGYTLDSLSSAQNFLTNYYKWLKFNFYNKLYIPKINHGPKGTIDIIWQEKDFRLFINIDNLNNKGNFYSNNNFQHSEGDFVLDKVQYNLFPIPIKYNL